MLYRHRHTGILVDAIEYVSDGKTIVAFVEWRKSPANLMNADGETFAAYYEEVPFNSRNLSNTYLSSTPDNRTFDRADERHIREIHFHFSDSLAGTHMLLDALKERGVI